MPRWSPPPSPEPYPGSTVGFVGWSLTEGDTVLQLEYVVPEPGTVMLLSTGVLGVVGFVRRRRRKV